MSASVDSKVEAQRDALLDRLIGAANGMWDIASVYLGGRLDLYTQLVALGEANSTQLAAATNLNERYVREWLEQQTVSGIVELTNPGAGALERTYRLPEGHVEVLTERESLNYLAPLANLTVGVMSKIQEVKEAFRTGGGVPYGEYGIDMHEGQAGMNRNLFLYQLGPDYLAQIPELDAVLASETPAKVADFGCGFGYSSIGIARHYRNALVDGFDLDEISVEAAQPLLREHGVADRVKIEVRDAGDPELAGQYDLVIACECVHDMSDPVSALRTMRRLVRPGGTTIVVDERVHEEFSPDGGDIERLMYGFSVLHCLPVGMVDQPSAGTGTVMRPGTFRGYAEEAGFSGVEVLPLDNLFFNFYRLSV